MSAMKLPKNPWGDTPKSILQRNFLEANNSIGKGKYLLVQSIGCR